MPDFDDPAAAVAAAHQALRGLVGSLSTINDPGQIHSILGPLAGGIATLSQVLHEIAALHDRPPFDAGWVAEDSRAARAAAYQVSWELHRAGEILRQVAETIEQSDGIEATITYERREVSIGFGAPPGVEHGIEM
jgi:hypothetical protein